MWEPWGQTSAGPRFKSPREGEKKLAATAGAAHPFQVYARTTEGWEGSSPEEGPLWGNLRKNGDLAVFWCNITTKYACGLLHEVQSVNTNTLLTFKLKCPCPASAPQVFLITAAGVADRLLSSPIGWRRQLRTADGWICEWPWFLTRVVGVFWHQLWAISAPRTTQIPAFFLFFF